MGGDNVGKKRKASTGKKIKFRDLKDKRVARVGKIRLQPRDLEYFKFLTTCNAFPSVPSVRLFFPTDGRIDYLRPGRNRLFRLDAKDYLHSLYYSGPEYGRARKKTWGLLYYLGAKGARAVDYHGVLPRRSKNDLWLYYWLGCLLEDLCLNYGLDLSVWMPSAVYKEKYGLEKHAPIHGVLWGDDGEHFVYLLKGYLAGSDVGRVFNFSERRVLRKNFYFILTPRECFKHNCGVLSPRSTFLTYLLTYEQAGEVITRLMVDRHYYLNRLLERVGGDKILLNDTGELFRYHTYIDGKKAYLLDLVTGDVKLFRDMLDYRSRTPVYVLCWPEQRSVIPPDRGYVVFEIERGERRVELYASASR
jgi:hypothetical protein